MVERLDRGDLSAWLDCASHDVLFVSVSSRCDSSLACLRCCHDELELWAVLRSVYAIPEMVAGLCIVHRPHLSSIVQRTWLFGPLKLGYVVGLLENMQLTKNRTGERDIVVWMNS